MTRGLVSSDLEQDLWQNSFGGWISVLWSSLAEVMPEESLAVQKETFFAVIGKWLGDGKIRFFPPAVGSSTMSVARTYNCGYGRWAASYADDRPVIFWNEDPGVIVAYLKAGWPAEARDAKDESLISYFYDPSLCPGILWVDEDGGLKAS